MWSTFGLVSADQGWFDFLSIPIEFNSRLAFCPFILIAMSIFVVFSAECFGTGRNGLEDRGGGMCAA